MYIYCETVKEDTKCRYCGEISSTVHGTYIRKIADLPIQKYKVKLIIKVRKYFCLNDKCNHKTFAEPLDFVGQNEIRTERLNKYIRDIGIRNSSMEAERQIKNSHVNISNNTILRILKKTER
jgi:transposase